MFGDWWAAVSSVSNCRCDKPSVGDSRGTRGRRTWSAGECSSWLGEVEGLKVSLAGAEDKRAQIDQRSQPTNPVNIGMPTFARITETNLPTSPSVRPSHD